MPTTLSPETRKTDGPAPREAAGFARLGGEILELRGPGRVDFLNSYNTQDIKSLPAAKGGYGAILTQKGKLVSDTWILHLKEKILLLVETGFSQKVLDHLKTFLMFADATLEDRTQAWVHLGIFGDQAIGALPSDWEIKAELGQLQAAEWEGKEIWLFYSDRFGIPGWEILGPTEIEPKLTKRIRDAGLKEIPRLTLEGFRIEAGIPRMGVDMREDHLVAEVGLDKRATSFNKGCYLGQETTARLNSQGHANRALTRLKLAQSYLGPLPAEIRAGEKTVGQLTSVAMSPRFGGPIGLGVVHRMAWEGEGKIFIEGPEGPIELEKI